MISGKHQSFRSHLPDDVEHLLAVTARVVEMRHGAVHVQPHIGTQPTHVSLLLGSGPVYAELRVGDQDALDTRLARFLDDDETLAGAEVTRVQDGAILGHQVEDLVDLGPQTSVLGKDLDPPGSPSTWR